MMELLRFTEDGTSTEDTFIFILEYADNDSTQWNKVRPFLVLLSETSRETSRCCCPAPMRVRHDLSKSILPHYTWDTMVLEPWVLRCSKRLFDQTFYARYHGWCYNLITEAYYFQILKKYSNKTSWRLTKGIKHWCTTKKKLENSSKISCGSLTSNQAHTKNYTNALDYGTPTH